MPNDNKDGSQAIVVSTFPILVDIAKQVDGLVHYYNNGSSEAYIILKKTSTGWTSHHGTNREEAAIILSDTQSQRDAKRREEELHKSGIRNDMIANLINSVGDQLIKLGKFLRGY